MQFPFDTTTKDGRKATVLGTMPDGRLAGYIKRPDDKLVSWSWDADGSDPASNLSITLPIRVKPLTTYRMRNGGIAWTSGLILNGWIYGMTSSGETIGWQVSDGRWGVQGEHPLDLIEELPPGTTD